jgi:hypothetical protein
LTFSGSRHVSDGHWNLTPLLTDNFLLRFWDKRPLNTSWKCQSVVWWSAKEDLSGSQDRIPLHRLSKSSLRNLWGTNLHKTWCYLVAMSTSEMWTLFDPADDSPQQGFVWLGLGN